MNIAKALTSVATKAREALSMHRRFGHFYIPGLCVDCPECSLSKTKDCGPKHQSERPIYTVPKAFLDQVDWDFCGPFETASIDGNRWILSGVDVYTKWVETFTLGYKSECADALERFCRRVGQPLVCRSDNAPEFKGEKSKWRVFCNDQKPKIRYDYSAPYEPQENGVVERWNRTMGDAIRANLQGVDPRLWDYCAKYCSYVWVRVPRRKGKKSPFEMRYGREPATRHLRPFGCLVYAKVHVDVPKLANRYERGMFLGYAENGTFLVGLWRPDARVKGGERFTVIENKSVKFCENIKVKSVDDLAKYSKGTFVAFPSHESLVEVECPGDVGVVPPGPCSPACGARDVPGPSSPEEVCADSAADPPVFGQKRPAGSPEDVSQSPNPVSGGGDADERITIDENGVTRKKRGRKVGTRALPHWSKPGPKPKQKTRNQRKRQKKAATAQAAATETGEQADLNASCELDWDLFDFLAGKASIEETALSFHVQLSNKTVMAKPDALKYIEADTLERTQLEAHKCWRPLEDNELTPDDEVIPSVVIYSRKRCGRYKARLVALGNRQKRSLAGEIFSPTVSHAANRVLLCEAAANGHYLDQFDISNAFIQAVLQDERVFIRLPAHWSKSNRGDVVRLLKSLYGLKIAPRRWFDTYRKYLESAGWQMCPREPGLFRKDGMILSMYVDDSLISGPCKAKVREETNRILSRFSGKIIHPVVGADGVETRDLLGATLLYCREKKSVKIHMRDAIAKLLKKYNMSGCRPSAVPCVPGRLDTGVKCDKFPLRQLVGGLLYVAVICRPDISFAVQRCARQVTDVTEGAVQAAKRILRYLSGTMETGIEYSPDIEKDFRSTYLELAKQSGQSELPHAVAFSDSDFAGCSVTLRSTSGSVLYWRGMPVCWSAKRQTVRAGSTCEAEYCAVHDLIKISTSLGFLDWYLVEREMPLIFCDNQSALKLSQSSIATKKSKHFALRYMLVQEHTKDLAYVPSGLNKSDPLTKALPRQKYLSIFGPAHVYETYAEDEPEFARAFYVTGLLASDAAEDPMVQACLAQGR